MKDGIACAKTSNEFWHIDERGLPIHNKTFVDLGVFHKEYATARDKGGWFHIGRDGSELYKERYDMIEPFYNGFSIVETLGNNKQIIDEQGIKELKLNSRYAIQIFIETDKIPKYITKIENTHFKKTEY